MPAGSQVKVGLWFDFFLEEGGGPPSFLTVQALGPRDRPTEMFLTFSKVNAD